MRIGHQIFLTATDLKPYMAKLKEQSGIHVVVALLLTTATLLLTHKYALNQVLVIDVNSGYPVVPVDDREVGGSSIAELKQQDGAYILECQIGEGYAWPFCEIGIVLRHKDARGNIVGIDLSKFDRIGVWAKYENRTKTGIRVHLRNFNPRYSTLNNPETLKYNSIEFYDFNSDYPLLTSMNSFQVATWWQVMQQISLHDMEPEFTNVHTIEVTTQTNAPVGFYRLIVEKIEFHGKLLRTATLYRLILMLWTAASIIYIVRWMVMYKRELNTSKSRQQELEAVNKLLDFKSSRLENQVNRDSLTGLLNRQGLETMIVNALMTEEKLNGLCIVFMDLDHFKKINDTFGHKVGDEVLMQFANLIKDHIRKSDVVARWGGEEFILACPKANAQDIMGLTEKLRALVERQHWPGDLSVTCSFGVSIMQPNELFDTAIERADQALYQAKRKGRNCVVLSQ